MASLRAKTSTNSLHQERTHAKSFSQSKCLELLHYVGIKKKFKSKIEERERLRVTGGHKLGVLARFDSQQLPVFSLSSIFASKLSLLLSCSLPSE